MKGAGLGAVLMTVLATAPGAAGAEGGSGHYVPGGTATLIDLAPTKPGWVIEPIYLHYGGSAPASRSIPAQNSRLGGTPSEPKPSP